MKSILATTAIALLALTACKKSSCSGAVEARIKDLTGLDGCGRVIQLADHSYIEPINLTDFDNSLANGDKVWVSYHLANSGGTICMVGDMVIIDCIEKK